MEAAHGHARTKIKLVTACSHRAPSCSHPNPADLRYTDLVESTSAVFGPAIARHFLNYDGPRPNLNRSGGGVNNKIPGRSTSYHKPSGASFPTIHRAGAGARQHGDDQQA